MRARDDKETDFPDAENSDERERCFQLEAEQVSLEERLGEKLLDLAEQRKRAHHVRVSWLKRFGRLLLSLEEHSARVDILRKRSDLAELFDDLDEEELDRKMAELAEESERRKRQLEEEVARAPHVKPWKSDGGQVDTAVLENYRAQIKGLLIELWLLLHPDKLEHDPRYVALADELKVELQAIRKRTPSPRTAELCFAPNQVGFDLPSLATLLADLRRARTVLEAAGIVLDTASEEPEQTLASRIGQLEVEIELLKNALRDASVELLTLYEDEELRCMKHEIASPEIHEEIERRFRVRIDELICEAGRLEDGLTGRPDGSTR